MYGYSIARWPYINFKVIGSVVVIWVKILKTEKTIEIDLVRLTEVCGKV